MFYFFYKNCAGHGSPSQQEHNDSSSTSMVIVENSLGYTIVEIS